MVTSGGNWEAEQLEKSFSKRVNAGWGAYWVAGARQEPLPVPPIVFTGGIPDPDTLPVEALIEASNAVLRREGPDALRYGGHQGHPGLREWLAQQANLRDGVNVTADNFTMTNGVSGGIVNVCETFIDEGDVGLAELPTYPGGAGTIRHALGEIAGVQLDAEGLVPASLEETIARLEREARRVKLLYTIPNFQNPTGAMMTLERRRAVVDICARHGVFIVEDNAYGDIQFEGERLPSLFAVAGGKGVAHVGTFSKTVATGLRVGWVMAGVPVIEALLRTRFDLGTNPWMQRTMLEFASDGTFARHVEKMNELYRHKRDVLLSALEERCARYATWSRPAGGYFLWLDLAPAIDPDALAQAARRIGVAFVGGASFFHGTGQGRHSIRLAFSYVREDEIAEGIMRLGRAMEEAAGAPAK